MTPLSFDGVERMRITIMGSGGVGGYFGTRLALGGCGVGFVARGAHLAALRANVAAAGRKRLSILMKKRWAEKRKTAS